MFRVHPKYDSPCQIKPEIVEGIAINFQGSIFKTENHNNDKREYLSSNFNLNKKVNSCLQPNYLIKISCNKLINKGRSRVDAFLMRVKIKEK